MNKQEFYNGNPFLPKAGILREITPEQKIEFQKCYDDPIYFCEKYFKIVHQKKGLVRMELFEFQKKAIRLYMETGKLIMNASRQSGKTSVITVIILHAAIFNKHKNLALLSNKLGAAVEILDRIKMAYEYLPDFLKPGILEWNKKSVKFENGTKIFADASEGSSIRGKSIYLLYVDEAAFIEDWDTFASAVLPTISAADTEEYDNEDGDEEEGEGSRIIFTSTPKGLNHFYYYCMDAQQEGAEFAYMEVPWWDVPGRGEKWKASALKILKGDLQKFDQEYCCAFHGSSGTLISGSALKLMISRIQEPIQSDEDLKIYARPEKDHIYVMTVDTSRGKMLDYHCLQIFDVSVNPYMQVATFRNNKMTIPDYAGVCFRMGEYYNKASILIEFNDLGPQLSDILHYSYEYENMIYTENKGRAGRKVAAHGGRKADRGIPANGGSSRSQGCFWLKTMVEQDILRIIDKSTVDELNTFSLKGKKYEAEEGNHDDTVMPLIWFAWLANQDYFKVLTDVDTVQMLRTKTEEEADDILLPLGIVVTADDDLVYVEDNMVIFNDPDGWGSLF